MNMTQAFTKIKKALGKDAAVRDNKRPTSPELRETKRAARLAAQAHKDNCTLVMEERRKELLAADPRYQELKAAHAEALSVLNKTPYGHDYRYEAGLHLGWCFSIKAQADSLAELVERIESERTKERSAA